MTNWGKRNGTLKTESLVLTVEAHGADVGQQFFAVDVGHSRAQACVSCAEVPVHLVEGVGHGVHGVHHELHLPLLLIRGVTAHLLQTCEENKDYVLQQHLPRVLSTLRNLKHANVR